ncbi:MAG: hypothetical protein AAAFM81_09320 [Pseudomonadota bacterium]
MRIPADIKKGQLTVCVPARSSTVVEHLQALLSDRPDLIVDSLSLEGMIDLSPAWTSPAATIAHVSGVSTDDDDWFGLLDPVCLAADMRDVRLQAWPINDLDEDHEKGLMSDIQSLLASDPDARVSQWKLAIASDAHWLVSAPIGAAIDVTTESPSAWIGDALREYQPVGQDAGLVRRLSTEWQMSLHAHVANEARAQQGRAPVNGLWLYGCGQPISRPNMPLPRLATDWSLLAAWWQFSGNERQLVREIPPTLSALSDVRILAPINWAPELTKALHALDAGDLRQVFLVTRWDCWSIKRRRWWQRAQTEMPN